MSKREVVAVYVGGKFIRHVTRKQDAASVAGKVLKRRAGYKRVAQKVALSGGGSGWACAYQLEGGAL